MVVDAPPAAVGVDGNGDIGRTAVGDKVAGCTVAGLVDKACFGGKHGAAGLFILYAAQKPVGAQQSFGMLLGRLEIFPIMMLFVPSTWRRT